MLLITTPLRNVLKGGYSKLYNIYINIIDVAATYLNDISIETEQIKDALTVELGGVHAVHHQHTGRIAAT